MVAFRPLTGISVCFLSIFVPLAIAGGFYDARQYDSRSLIERAGTTTGSSLCHTVALSAPLNVSTCTTSSGSGIVGGVVSGLGNTLSCTVSAVQVQVAINDSVCLCLAAGVLTPNSVAQLQAIISANGTGVNELTSVVNGTIGYTATSLLNYLESVEPTLLSNYQTSCVYPTNSIPISCSACGYTCADGYKQCGSSCIVNTTTCASGAAKRKIDDYALDPNLRCPTGLTACMVPDSGPWNGDNFECIDTRRDLESCGGCAYPLPFRPEGQDCTAIANAATVSCQSSSCVVHDCDDGFVSNGTTCMRDAASPLSASDLLFDSAELLLRKRAMPGGAAAMPAFARQGRGDSKRADADFWRRLQVKTDDLRSGKKRKAASRREREAERAQLQAQWRQAAVAGHGPGAL